MTEFTPNYGLEKPRGTDFYNLSVNNENTDKIDKALGSLTTQLADTMKNQESTGITCSNLGMKAKDINYAHENTEIIINAINNGNHIIVDDVYYLKAEDSLVSSDVTILGKDEKCGFVFEGENSSYFIKMLSLFNVVISGITVKNNTQKGIRFVYSYLDTSEEIKRTELVSINNTNVSGKINMYFAACTLGLNPLVSKYGIDRVFVTGNHCTNNTRSFIELYDTPLTKANIENNQTINWDGVFVNIGITNSQTYEYELCSSIEDVNIGNNLAICTDDYYFASTGGYVGFALIESDKCTFVNNHIEGLKNKIPSTSLYYAYISSRDVTVRGNVVKNCLSLWDGHNDSDIMINKDGVYGDKKGKRIYDGNEFILEKEWLVKIGANLNTAYYNSCKLQQEIQNTTFINNVVDVYYLKGFNEPTYEGFDMINLFFSNNTIKLERGIGSFFKIRINDGKDYTNTVQEISGNNITCVEGSLNIVSHYQKGSNKLKNVVVKNNTCNNGAIPINSIYSENTIIKNNIFNNNSSSTIVLMNGGDYGNLTYDNNIINTSGTKLSLISWTPHKNKLLYNSTFNGFFTSSNYQGFPFSYLVNPMASEIKYFIEVEIFYKTGKQKFTCEFSYGYDVSNGNYLKFINTSGVEEILYLKTTNGTKYIKLQNNTTTTTATMRIYSTTDYCFVSPVIGDNVVAKISVTGL